MAGANHQQRLAGGVEPVRQQDDSQSRLGRCDGGGRPVLGERDRGCIQYAAGLETMAAKTALRFEYLIADCRQPPLGNGIDLDNNGFGQVSPIGFDEGNRGSRGWNDFGFISVVRHFPVDRAPFLTFPKADAIWSRGEQDQFKRP